MSEPVSLIDPDRVKFTAELASQTPPGAFVEVGVYKGGSAYVLASVAREQGRELHLFDTFNGIPFSGPGDGHKVGDFGDASLEAVKAAIPDAVFHVGAFPYTMPIEFPPVSFVHCDCDQVESVRAVIDIFWHRLPVGGIIVFDDMDQEGCKPLIEDRMRGFLHLQNVRWFARKEGV
jgi:O-methyltransferase